MTIMLFLIPDVQEEFSPKRERSPSLLQEEPEPPEIKVEEEELQRQPEEPDGSTLTSLAVKSEVKDEEDISDHLQESSGGQSQLHLG